MVWVCFYLLYRVLAGPFSLGTLSSCVKLFGIILLIPSFLFFSSCLYGASIKWMIHLGSDLIFLSSFLIVQVFVLLFTFWGFFSALSSQSFHWVYHFYWSSSSFQAAFSLSSFCSCLMDVILSELTNDRFPPPSCALDFFHFPLFSYFALTCSPYAKPGAPPWKLVMLEGLLMRNVGQ